MIVYISSFEKTPAMEKLPDEEWARINGLMSFAVMSPSSKVVIPKLKRFLLDSGAFTFMRQKLNSKKVEVDWDQYIGSYCDFVVENDVKNFFEMDVDSIVGYNKVKEFRKQITKRTGRLPIPVWHIERGRQDYQNMCSEYPYVAVGGIVAKAKHHEVSIDMMKWLVDEAHQRGAIIHGLGVTRPSILEKVHFDSVDSSAYLRHSCYGIIHDFRRNQMKCYEVGKALGLTTEQFSKKNLEVWTQYAEYAESHL